MAHLPLGVVMDLWMCGMETIKRGCIRYFAKFWCVFHFIMGILVLVLKVCFFLILLALLKWNYSILNTQQASQPCHSAEMGGFWLSLLVIHLKRVINRKNTLLHSIPVLCILAFFCFASWPTLHCLFLCSHEPDAIFVRGVNEVEVKPKPKVLPNPSTWRDVARNC